MYEGAKGERRSMTNGDMDRQLDSLFQAYKDACPDMDGSVNFSPNLWQKIEARRALPRTMARFGRLFVSAAAALCLVMSLLLVSPGSQAGSPLSYVEALDNEQSHELMAYADADTNRPGESQ
jgi:hypothetical protein